MSRNTDVQAMLEVADETFQRIEELYKRALAEKSISPKLSVYIKNYLENLRSPLDYLACEISEEVLKRGKQKVYYPVACENRKAFDSFMVRNLPDLDSAHAGLFKKIEDAQAYNSSGCRALPKLSKLVNENKHSHLSHQVKREERGITIDFSGRAKIVMGPGASISGGGLISSGRGWFSPAGGVVSGESPATHGENIRQTIDTWVSFTFLDSGDEVMSLLRACHNDVQRIVDEIGSLIWR
jgi:hypothetical protein